LKIQDFLGKKLKMEKQLTERLWEGTGSHPTDPSSKYVAAVTYWICGGWNLEFITDKCNIEKNHGMHIKNKFFKDV